MDKEGLRKQGYDEEENDSDESTVTVASGGMDSVSLCLFDQMRELLKQ